MESQFGWNYAAGFYLDLVDRIKAGDQNIVVWPRYMCAALLFLRSAHESYAAARGQSTKDLEPTDMVSFVWESKNAIIHDGEAMSLVAGKAMSRDQVPPDFKGLAVQFTDISIDLDADPSQPSMKDSMIAAREYLGRRGDSAVRALYDSLLETADLLGIDSPLVGRVRTQQLVVL